LQVTGFEDVGESWSHARHKYLTSWQMTDCE
jgi:hypothetical protein